MDVAEQHVFMQIISMKYMICMDQTPFRFLFSLIEIHCQKHHSSHASKGYKKLCISIFSA